MFTITQYRPAARRRKKINIFMIHYKSSLLVAQNEFQVRPCDRLKCANVGAGALDPPEGVRRMKYMMQGEDW
jgi:hypothetical protein